MKRGSITLQLSLVLGLSLSLVLYSIRSVRIADGRVLMSSALEQGLYSLFAGYDRDLFEEYGLLFLDGGYGGKDLQPGRICREVTEAAEYIVDPGKGVGGARTLSGFQLSGGEVTGYLLATDQSGAAFQSQVSRIMAERLGTAGVQMLAAELTDGWEISGEQEEYQRNADPEGAIREYESCLETAAEQTGGEGTAFKKGVSGTVFLTDSEMVPEDSVSQAVPENFQNPIDTVLGMRTMGILTLAIPDPANLSAYTLGEEQLVSRRTLQQGMGMPPRDEDGTFDRLLMLEFLAETFPCYTSQSQEEGLKYQVEYAIGRKNSDRENLKTVLDRLMMIRGASNFLYLMTSSVRGAEADQMAWIISLALLMPQIQPLVSMVLKGCWAYGESILDLRVLLEGGKIPLVKDDSSWQLSLTGLSGILTAAGGERDSGKGMDYTWYLRMLLFAESQKALTEAAMDLTEHNIRVRCARPDFCLDSCVYAAEICLRGQADIQPIYITRSYGYDMEGS